MIRLVTSHPILDHPPPNTGSSPTGVQPAFAGTFSDKRNSLGQTAALFLEQSFFLALGTTRNEFNPSFTFMLKALTHRLSFQFPRSLTSPYATEHVFWSLTVMLSGRHCRQGYSNRHRGLPCYTQ